MKQRHKMAGAKKAKSSKLHYAGGGPHCPSGLHRFVIRASG